MIQKRRHFQTVLLTGTQGFDVYTLKSSKLKFTRNGGKFPANNMSDLQCARMCSEYNNGKFPSYALIFNDTMLQISA